MKTSHKTVISGVLILALIIGAAVIIQLGAPPPAEANVMFEPGTIDLEAPGSVLKEVVVSLWFPRKYDGRDVDPRSGILIEGILEPKGGWKKTWVERILVGEGKSKKQAWAFRFRISAGDLRNLLWQKIGHMTPGVVYEIPLEVTGNLYDGTAFTGTGIMKALASNPTPPPPPPP